MDWRAPHLPPLLRGLGTLVLLATSIGVGLVEHGQAEAAQQAREKARQQLEAKMAEGVAEGRTANLTEEIRLLRLQAQDADLAGQVFENGWFQLLGVLGTLMISGSFFVEAAQRRPRAPTDDPST